MMAMSKGKEMMKAKEKMKHTSKFIFFDKLILLLIVLHIFHVAYFKYPHQHFILAKSLINGQIN